MLGDVKVSDKSSFWIVRANGSTRLESQSFAYDRSKSYNVNLIAEKAQTEKGGKAVPVIYSRKKETGAVGVFIAPAIK